ncbi:MAG: DUF4212 domain-containing protein [Hyphomicrobium sp.]|nr:DUF4212 domain-containing protein [Hyphomicrobium sp.]
MRLLKIGIGLVAIVAAMASAVGWLDAVVAFPALSTSSAAFVIAAGIALLTNGILGFVVANTADGLKSRFAAAQLATSTVVFVAVVILAIPVLNRALSLFTIGGFPLGYWFVAQGAALLLVMLAFRHEAKTAASEADTADARDAR